GIDLIETSSRMGAAPVLILTAFGNQADAIQALRRGALDYVVKSESTLLDMPHIVERAIAQSQLQSRSESMQRALLESEQRYALALNGSKDVVWDWDIDSGSLFLSTRWQDVFSPVVPPTFEEWKALIHPQEADTFQGQLQVHLQ